MYTTLFLLSCNLLLTATPAGSPAPSDSQKIIITAPKSGDTLFINDSVTIKWETIEDIISVDVLVSPNKGKNWLRLNSVSIPYYNTTQWSNFKWRIPEKITIDSHEFSLVDNASVLFRAESYSPKNSSEISVIASPVTIKLRTNAVIPGKIFRQVPQYQQVNLSSQSDLKVLNISCNGRVIGPVQQSSSGLIFQLINDLSARNTTLQKSGLLINK
jgi:hypothetical protein